MKIGVLVILAILGLYGCTDATWSKFSQLGSPQSIKCYSGGVVIYEGESTGKVQSEHQSDGYYWEDAKTHKIVEVSANCIFTAK